MNPFIPLKTLNSTIYDLPVNILYEITGVNPSLKKGFLAPHWGVGP